MSTQGSPLANMVASSPRGSRYSRVRRGAEQAGAAVGAGIDLREYLVMFTTVITPNVTGNRPTIPGRKYRDKFTEFARSMGVPVRSVIRSTSYDIAQRIRNPLGDAIHHPGSALACSPRTRLKPSPGSL